MLKKFMELFGAENLLDTAYETTIKMLEFDHRMYDASRHTLRETDTSELVRLLEAEESIEVRIRSMK